ncbi:hypothetical protein EC973_001135 [Apophysomyces ossiformis]|uniref:Sialate O-acetylesterase domain-containing protein n=1 Tax=Apophysomyces ossiformis TaxID=679940 RepID=A0A8H7EPJ8_9FUNG|nr:hypothetical protein EC973_001135 [Apophysomyces ossiformis]
MDQIMYTQVSSYQVLQRDFETNTAKVQVDDQIITLPVGGPYTLGNAHHVLVGDVWVMAGQSNMRGHGYYNPQLPPLTTSLVHMFRSSERWDKASDPTHQLWESPRSVHRLLPDPTVRDPAIRDIRGASLGLAFAESYQAQNAAVPVGLIPSAHGGVTLAQWHTDDPLSDDTLYGAMCSRIHAAGGKIAGVLWYQGESDAAAEDDDDDDEEKHAFYAARMQTWINHTRERFGDHVYFVAAQIGRWLANNHSLSWSRLRMEQTKLMSIPKASVISTIDCEMDDHVHLSEKGLRVVGRRMALAATALLHRPPTSSSDHEPYCCLIGKEARRTILKVVFPGFMHWQDVGRAFGFTVVDSTYHESGTIFSARIEADAIYLYVSPETGEALKTKSWRLWYGFGSNPICNLVDNRNMSPLAGEILYISC